MPEVELPYGRSKIRIDVPDHNLMAVIRPRPTAGLPDPVGAIKDALAHPIGMPPLDELVKPTSSVAILVDDITRPTPTRLMIKPILGTLRALGVPSQQITVVFATGAHRQQTPQEHTRIVGADVLSEIKAVDHNCDDASFLTNLGSTRRGTPVHVNRIVADADLRILIGCIKPSDVAGYTGGGKAILPGVSSRETITIDHGFQGTAHPKSVVGVIDGNPIRDDIEEAASLVGPCFIVNAILNPKKEIIGIVAGHMVHAHRQGAILFDTMAKVKVPQKADIVLSAVADPIDICLYQAINGLVTPTRIPEPVVKMGGVIILSGECREGVGHRAFVDLYRQAGSPTALYDMLRNSAHWITEQYAAQIWADIVRQVRVIAVTPGVDRHALLDLGATPADSIEDGLRLALGWMGDQASILVMPDAGYTIPTL